MKTIRNIINKLNEYDIKQKYKYQVSSTIVILGIVLIFMSAINVLTIEYQLLVVTGTFGILFLFLGFLIYKSYISRVIADIFIYFFVIFIFSYFIITGHPQGFSIVWLLILPSVSLYLFGIKRGSILSLIAFCILIFLFYVPYGKDLLQYDYNNAFLIRTPIAYITFYVVSLFLEFSRETTETALKNERKKYYYLSTHDPLTKTYNRLALNDIIKKEFSNSKNKTTVFVIFDIDDFKNINDSFGHKAGDKVLVDFSNILNQVFLNGYVSRWGGEEFAVIFDAKDSDFIALAKRCLSNIASYKFKYQNLFLHVTTSMGLTYTKKNNVDYDALFIYADELLYQAKASGKNKLIVKEFK